MSPLPARLAIGLLAAATVGLPAATAQEVPLDSVQAWVLRAHPLARAADAVEARGPAALMAARGAFDPTLQADFDRKDYLGSRYYQYGDVGLSWQSPYALKVEAGREWAEGVFLNDERTVPAAGQGYVSVKLNVLQGLITDPARTDVARAEVGVERNRAAAGVIRNELLYDVSTRYAEWAYAELQLAIYRATEELIELRLTQTRGLLAGGDRPAVDTLEAYVALVNQRLTTQQGAVDARVAAQQLRAIYWPLPEDAESPEGALLVALPALDADALANPEIAELAAQFRDVDLERRLKRQYLLPKLAVGYSLLGDGFELAPTSEKVDDRSLLTRAYKVGASFRYPLLTRSARGDLELSDLKLAETGAKLADKRRQLVAKAEAFASAAVAYTAQLREVDDLRRQAVRLLEAERALFDLGESTQFLLNSREQSVQKARLTLAKLRFSRAKAIFSYRQATGDWAG